MSLMIRNEWNIVVKESGWLIILILVGLRNEKREWKERKKYRENLCWRRKMGEMNEEWASVPFVNERMW